jgi:hypothetical protein
MLVLIAVRRLLCPPSEPVTFGSCAAWRLRAATSVPATADGSQLKRLEARRTRSARMRAV